MQKPFALIGLLSMLAACAPARTAPPPAAPAPAQPAPPAPAAPAPTAPDEAAVPDVPRNWQLLDPATDHVPGISALRAERQLLAGKRPARTVVVAVIDGGVDTAHADLEASLWTNPKEVAGNHKDDDGNGYTDDVHGWNFIGGPDGRDVRYDTYEVTRQYVLCTADSAAATGDSPSSGSRDAADTLAPARPQRCDQVVEDFNRERSEAEQTLQRIQMADDALTRASELLRQELGTDSLTPDRVATLESSQPEVQRAKAVYLQLAAAGITPAVVAEAKEAFTSRLEYALDPSYNPRPIVGDHYNDLSERHYGNTDVMGPDALHGTHVAGIIAATRDNDVGIDGIAPAARVMIVRTVPDGDERDKDVANAIRYAVDNGANIINMSFGKAYSPQKSAVDEAVKYADAHGVLMIHAAGNDGKNLTDSLNRNFPSRTYLDGGEARNWIEVGASSWRGADSLAAPFSNYGNGVVDVFAPGVDILSTVPGNEYERESGTSMAAPVVTGLAALIMAYEPSLSAADVKHVILATVTPYKQQPVLVPGSENGKEVPFGWLSTTGGVVNAFAAIRMAEQMSAAKP